MNLDEDYLSLFEDTLSESLLTKDNIELNLDKWVPGTILFITGLSGGGKTTISKKLAEENNAEYFELDFLFSSIMKDKQWAFEKLKTCYTEKGLNNTIRSFISSLDDSLFQNKNSLVPLSDKQDIYRKMLSICTDFCKYASEHLKNSKIKYIFEGTEIFNTNDIDFFKDKPLILVGTGLIKSNYRASKRILKKKNVPNERKRSEVKYRIVSLFDKNTNNHKHSIEYDNFKKEILKEDVINENFESLIARPREFFKKVQLWRVSLFKEDMVGQHSFNPGTLLSKPRMSSFWIAGDHPEWTDIYGFRIALTKLYEDTYKSSISDFDPDNVKEFTEKMKAKCRFDLKDRGFCINAKNFPEEYVRKNLPIVYRYGLKIHGYETGIGWHNKTEYTIDKDIKADTVEELDYDYFKKHIELVYLPEDEYLKKLAEKKANNEKKLKDPNYKKWDDEIGFPYPKDPRVFAAERYTEYFNKMIKSAMYEKDIKTREKLIDDIAEKYKLISGYKLKMFKTDNSKINIPDEYKMKFALSEDYLPLFETVINEKSNIYAYYACTGRSYAENILKEKGYSVFTIEKERDFYKNWPNADVYSKYINQLSKKYDIVFIPYFIGMEERMIKGKVNYTLFYPSKSCKEEYRKRMKDANFTEEQIEYLISHWDEMQEDVKKSPHRIVLKSGEYLLDKILK